MKRDLNERIEMVKAMNIIALHCNDERCIEKWLINGVADGDDDFEYYASDDETFADLMDTFMWVMGRSSEKRKAHLYCNGVASKSAYDN